MSSSTDADVLLELAGDINIFRSEWKEVYADIDVDGHRETWPVASQEFKDRLIDRFMRSEGRPLSGPALNNVLGALRAKAVIGAETKPVVLRVADLGGKRYLDLADDKWQAVEISKAGWKIISNPPVRFHRVRGMSPLPTPVRGGKINELRPFLGNLSDNGFVLVVGWLLTVLNARSPWPVLTFSGLQGSAKSCATRYTRSIIDPALASLGALPSTKDEYARAVGQNFILAWDNVSQISNKTSDILCQLSTGGYEPHYPRTIGRPCASHNRPIILNSIVHCVRRPDLADRALFVALEPIKDKARKKEEDLQTKFAKAWPRVLGALLDGVATGLASPTSNRLENVGRLVDMQHFVSGCEKTYWPEGTFASAYQESRKLAAGVLTEANPVATAVIRLIDDQVSFSGTATDLLRLLNAQERDIHIDGKLPGGPSPLSAELDRVSPLLEAQGIRVDRSRVGENGDRLIEIRRIAPPQPKSRSTKPSQIESKPSPESEQGELALDLSPPSFELEPA
jgi:hypothetical protein